jgi:hypothetical protein
VQFAASERANHNGSCRKTGSIIPERLQSNDAVTFSMRRTTRMPAILLL